MVKSMVVALMPQYGNFTYGEYGFCVIGSPCYLREWVEGLNTKLSCIATGELNVSMVALGPCSWIYNV